MKYHYFVSKIFSILLLLTIWSKPLDAQCDITKYSFSASSGTYVTITGDPHTITPAAPSSGDDDDGAFNIDIGFTFTYMGVQYSTISACTNGWMTFGQDNTNYATTNNLMSSSVTIRPVIAPLWDNIALYNHDPQHQGREFFSYQTQPDPNANGKNIFTAQWESVFWDHSISNPNPCISFQVKLYEATGAIQFLYKQESGGAVYGSPSASIGITTTSTGRGNFLSLSGTGTSPDTSSRTETATLNTRPATNQTYTFTPRSMQTDPPNLSFTSVTASSMTLNWTGTYDNESGFRIYQSTDDINYSLIATTAPNAVSYPVTGLIFGTTYYFKVIAFNEGYISSAISKSQITSPGTLHDTYYIPGDYASIKLAVQDINKKGLSGSVVLVLQSNYTGTGESYPIKAPHVADASHTVTIRPAAVLSITSSSSTAIFSFDTANYVTIDGRPGGTGVNSLTLSNTSTAGAAVLFINGASHNTIEYCSINGVNTHTDGGVVFFSTTNGANGNNNNLIDHCDIGNSIPPPRNCVFSLGSTATGMYNSRNTISNCNIYNFFHTAGDDNGIYLYNGNTEWTITGNSFYQAASNPNSSGQHIAINIDYTSTNSGNKFVISNNYIGGSSANAVGTWAIIGTANIFKGISLKAGTTASSIYGNTISNFDFSTSSSSSTAGGPWCGIYLAGGNAYIGGYVNSDNNYISAGNTIGSGTGTSYSIICTTSGAGAISSGIWIDGVTSTADIENNIIGAIKTIASNPATDSYGFSGIWLNDGTTYTINNNIIGSTSTPYNINASTSSTIATGQRVYGIYNKSASACTITNNTIANLNNAYAPTSQYTANCILGGILSASGSCTINDNTIIKLSANADVNNNNPIVYSVIGIGINGTGNASCSHNTIYELINNYSGFDGTVICGIYFNIVSSGTVVERNLIHTLVGGPYTSIFGIDIEKGATTYQNNMIRLGRDASGNSITYSCQIIGILETGTAIDNFYFNSVYIGGTNVGTAGGAARTYAFYSEIVTTHLRSYENNIFINERSNTLGTSSHYAITFGPSSSNQPLTTGLTIDHNIYHVNVTGGGVLGRFYGYDYTDLNHWQTGIGTKDIPSYYTDPQFISPEGNSYNGDLHIRTDTQTRVESYGVAIPGIDLDYDGQGRSFFTPTDIGADAGNFIPLDLTPPVISPFSPLDNIMYDPNSTNVRTLSVTITDPGSGVPTSGTGLPALWWKINNGTYTQATTSYNDETKQYTFTFGNGVTALDIVYYYIVARDCAPMPNFTSCPTALGYPSSDPPAFSIPPSIPFRYLVMIPALHGDYFINSTLFKQLKRQTITFEKSVTKKNLISTKSASKGISLPQDISRFYPSITAAINDLNLRGVSEPVRFLLDDHSYSEVFPITIDIINSTYPTNGANTVTIKPDAGVTTTITGSSPADAIFKINGNNFIIIDGSMEGGSGYSKDLTISNTSGADNSSVVSAASKGANLGAHIMINNCIITSGTISKNYGIYISGANNYFHIENNSISGFYCGIYAAAIENGVNDNTGIIGNIISAGSNCGQWGIFLKYATDAYISGNTIYNINGSSTWHNPVGLYISTGVTNSYITQNYFQDISDFQADGYGGKGLYVNTGTAASNLTIANNCIYGIQGSGSNNIFSSPVGMCFDGTSGGFNIYYNSVYMYGNITNKQNQTFTAAIAFNSAVTGIDLRNNVFQNVCNKDYQNFKPPIQPDWSMNFALYTDANFGAFTYLNYNDYYVYNPEYIDEAFPVHWCPGNFRYFSDWQYISCHFEGGKECNSVFGDPRFTTRPGESASKIDLHKKLNVDTPVSNSDKTKIDLHIKPNVHTPVSNSDTPIIDLHIQPNVYTPVYSFGTPIISNIYGVTHDIDGELHSSSTPEMGADEFTDYHPDVIPPTIITYTALDMATSTDARSLTATVTNNGNGVPSSGNGVPVLYWKINNGTYTPATGSFIQSDQFTFTFGSGVKGSDIVYYYIVARDNESYDVTSFPKGGASGFTHDPPAASTPPTTPSSYLVNVPTLSLTLTAFLEGYTNTGGTAMKNDLQPITVTVELHHITSPYGLVEAQTGTLSSVGVGTFAFTSAVNGTGYYIVVKSQNTVETWSAVPQSFTAGALSYDFTSAVTQAFTDGSGSPMLRKGSKWCFYSGDVTQDHQVTFSDLMAEDNDNSNYVTGATVTDLNGDQQVTFSDFIIVDNNNSFYVTRQYPGGISIAAKVRRPVKTHVQQQQ
jgi:trimeric autotransporter adhesin